MRRWGRSIAAVVGLLSAGCGDGMAPTPTPGAPVIACPANVTVRGVPGGTQAVTYTPPAVTGGATPVAVTCTPASGASFSVGTGAVSCNAIDALSRQAQCSFTVTLTPLLLSVTKFVAFGDSLTEGEDGRNARLGFGFIDPTGTYPVLLQTTLDTEYPGQSIVVLNRGRSGEFVDDGRQRLPGVLGADRPGVLLLLDGYNDLLSWCRPADAASARCATAITDVVAGVRKMIQTARNPAYGIQHIFVSTLTPPGPHVSGTNRRIAGQAIVETNTRLAPMARAEGAILVDPYPVFLGHESEYVADDGLHLRRAGYQALADTFFAAIRTTVSSTPTVSGVHH